MKILLIDNGTSLLAKLEDLIPGAEIVKKWDEEFNAEEFDMVVLSGSKDSSVVWNHELFQKEINLIQKTKKPLIGICFGCELIAYAFGGKLKELREVHKGIREIEFLSLDLSSEKKVKVYEHHKWIIESLPEPFVVLAQSSEGPELIKHKTLPIYGLQFHPENFTVETSGDEIFRTLLSKFK